MTRKFDVAVIGAGPAGMAAAAEAASAGAHVALVDMNSRLGGQYWRHGAQHEAPGSDSPRWHHGWAEYSRLAGAVADGVVRTRIEHIASTHVWAVDRDAECFVLRLARIAEARGSRGRQEVSELAATRVVLAPGAYDRQLPIPGWTLPGVMAAGGIQAFIKVQGIAPGTRAVLAGTGPFLLAAADSVLKAGGEVAAIVESSRPVRWMPRGLLAALVPSKGVEGAEYAAALARSRVPYLMSSIVSRIDGGQRVESVVVSRAHADGSPVPNTERTIEGIDLVGLGWGFTPQTELLLQLGAATRVDVDGSLVGVVDRELRSSVDGLLLAGEITGVKGAAGAVADGRIAGRAAAGASPRLLDLLTRQRHSAFAGAMHRAHPIPERWTSWLTSDTTVCRCEEVPYAEVRAAKGDLALDDPRSLKGATRVGMGYCQGRICGLAAQCLTRGGDAERADAARMVSKRPVGLPIELGAIAAEAARTAELD